MNFFGAGAAHHAHNLAARRSANDGVVNQDDALALEQIAHGIEFEFDAEVANPLLRLDERAAHIMITNQTEAKRKTGFFCIDRKSTRLNSSHLGISYAVFCLKKKKKQTRRIRNHPATRSTRTEASIH